ncbi:MAG: hypothetical protein U0T77_00100 [Chitinophagales bacterium]
MEFLKNPGFILRVIIAAGYILLGILLIIHPSALGFLTKDMTRAFSAVLIIYGLFRGYRAYQFYKDEK